ncbi:DNA-3-methyladenine glycosylase [Mesorhizobium sp. CAU 1732]|uniref:DNA-3-methyladenine glycosylase n=1 Tax=Mesorhizobium sp. CAU 1732 TaxID=3140358 RepID=UPI0032606425
MTPLDPAALNTEGGFRAFCDRPASDVAPELLGATLLHGGVGGIVVETEAYEHDDPASHSFAGRTVRNGAMFGQPGTAYVYRSYGLHWCFNVVCCPGSAVLIRAIEPTHGVDEMIRRRGIDDPRRLCAGPGRLCQALAIDGGLDGHPLNRTDLVLSPALQAQHIAGPRIGISKAVDLHRRYGLAGSRFLSRRF